MSKENVKRKKVRTLYESADKKTKKEADEFIELLEKGLIGRREPRQNIENNMSDSEYLQKCSKSFDNLISSDEFKEMMMRAYD